MLVSFSWFLVVSFARFMVNFSWFLMIVSFSWFLIVSFARFMMSFARFIVGLRRLIAGLEGFLVASFRCLIGFGCLRTCLALFARTMMVMSLIWFW